MKQRPTLCRNASYRIAGLFLVFLAILMTVSFVPADAQVQARRLYKVSNSDNRIGFIDKSGKLVIGFDRFPAGTYIGDFSDGLAPICFPHDPKYACENYGFIDETGKIVIPPRFKGAHGFSEGLALVETETSPGFIDRRGEMVIKLEDRISFGFKEGFAAVRTRQMGWGFIDRNGKFISEDRYLHVASFSEGLAAVAIGRGQQARYGFINKEGKMVIPARFEPSWGQFRIVGEISNLTRFADGLARIQIKDRFGYINKKGENVIPVQFRQAQDFSEGLACVQHEDGRSGFIDKTGRLVIKLESAGPHKFSEGLAVAGINTGSGLKLGYIDRTGKVVIPPKFLGAREFVDGVAEVRSYVKAKDGSGPHRTTLIGYIDRAGQYIWQPQ
jgi:hypothetical protein